MGGVVGTVHCDWSRGIARWGASSLLAQFFQFKDALSLSHSDGAWGKEFGSLTVVDSKRFLGKLRRDAIRTQAISICFKEKNRDE